VAPTDTVYGLVADINNPEAVNSVFTLKGRQKNKPLPIFIFSFEDLNNVVFVSDKRVEGLIKKLWPGKVTCILSARGWLPPDILSRPSSGLMYDPRGLRVGVRLPDHPFMRALLKAYKSPLSGTSANLSGQNSYTKIAELMNDFEKMPFKPDLIVDAGDLPVSLPSTIVDCTVWPPEIVREGAVSSVEFGNYLIDLV